MNQEATTAALDYWLMYGDSKHVTWLEAIVNNGGPSNALLKEHPGLCRSRMDHITAWLRIRKVIE